MAKKYIPNGYQIIDIERSLTSTDIFVVPTADLSDDEKLLREILSKNYYSKPILIRFRDVDANQMVQFAVVVGTSILVGDLSRTNFSSIYINYDSDGLQYDVSII